MPAPTRNDIRAAWDTEVIPVTFVCRGLSEKSRERERETYYTGDAFLSWGMIISSLLEGEGVGVVEAAH